MALVIKKPQAQGSPPKKVGVELAPKNVENDIEVMHGLMHGVEEVLPVLDPLKIHGIPKEIFDIGILDREYHERLLADLDRVAETAGIQKHFVWAKLSEYCTEHEVTWVRRMKQGKDHGLAYIGKQSKTIEDKMMAMAGACLRNYIDARMMPVQEVLTRLKNDTMPQPTVLLIPNFSLEKKDGGDIPQWQVSSLLGLLYTRLARGLKTVVYISDLNGLSLFYGESFKKHIESHYTKI